MSNGPVNSSESCVLINPYLYLIDAFSRTLKIADWYFTARDHLVQRGVLLRGTWRQLVIFCSCFCLDAHKWEEYYKLVCLSSSITSSLLMLSVTYQCPTCELLWFTLIITLVHLHNKYVKMVYRSNSGTFTYRWFYTLTAGRIFSTSLLLIYISPASCKSV